MEAKFPGPGVSLGDNPRKPWEGKGDGREWRAESEGEKEEGGCPREHLLPSGAKFL